MKSSASPSKPPPPHPLVALPPLALPRPPLPPHQPILPPLLPLPHPQPPPRLLQKQPPLPSQVLLLLPPKLSPFPKLALYCLPLSDYSPAPSLSSEPFSLLSRPSPPARLPPVYPSIPHHINHYQQPPHSSTSPVTLLCWNFFSLRLFDWRFRRWLFCALLCRRLCLLLGFFPLFLLLLCFSQLHL